MKPKYQVDFAKPIDYTIEKQYTLKNYLDKDKYNWVKNEYRKFNNHTNSWDNIFLTNKKIAIRIKIHLGEKKRYDPFNEFPKLPKTYQDYKEISIYLISTIFFKKFNSQELFEIMAILTKETPFIELKYFNIGERYGYEDSTIVKHDNKLIKSFNVIINDKLFGLYDYLVNYKSNKSELEITTIVKEYLESLDFEINIENTEIEEKYNNENNSERYTIEDSYNDGGGGGEWSDPSEFW